MVYTQCVCRWLCRCVTGGLPACTPQQRGRPGYRPQWIRVACWESWQRHCHEAELRTVGESCNDDSMGRVRFWLGSRSPSFERPVGELAIAWRVPALPQSLPVFPLHALPQVTTWRFVPAAHTDRSQYIDGSPRMVLVARGCPPPPDRHMRSSAVEADRCRNAARSARQCFGANSPSRVWAIDRLWSVFCVSGDCPRPFHRRGKPNGTERCWSRRKRCGDKRRPFKTIKFSPGLPARPPSATPPSENSRL